MNGIKKVLIPKYSNYEVIGAKWYLKAADEGNARAMNNLGLCYLNGYGVGQNDNEAFKWFSKGAEAGNLTAMTNVGFCYEFGRGTEANPTEAMNWYQKALDNGYQINDWLSQRLKECNAKKNNRPFAKILSIWALNTNPNDVSENSYGNDSSFIVHCHIQVDNMNGKI